MLLRPDTGPEAIAFETEVIELLLQSKRQQSGGGGGGGGGSSNSGGGNNGGWQGLGPERHRPPGPRQRGPGHLGPGVEQSTGKAGRELPKNSAAASNSYFNKLETN